MNTHFKRTTQLVCAISIPIAASISCADGTTVYDLLQSSYPDYSITDTSGLEADVAKIFQDDIDATTTVIADFDGNELEDYAFLLRNHADTESVFVVYLQTSRNRFEEFELDRNRVLPDYIEEVAPNVTFRSFDGDENGLNGGPVTLSYSAILGIHYAKSSRIDYWDGKSKVFKTVWTSD